MNLATWALVALRLRSRRRGPTAVERLRELVPPPSDLWLGEGPGGSSRAAQLRSDG